jgi:hypothetical protein
MGQTLQLLNGEHGCTRANTETLWRPNDVYLHRYLDSSSPPQTRSSDGMVYSGYQARMFGLARAKALSSHVIWGVPLFPLLFRFRISETPRASGYPARGGDWPMIIFVRQPSNFPCFVSLIILFPFPGDYLQILALDLT